MKERIMLALRKFGPMLPAEIASRINADSFMAKAHLSELVSEGKIAASKQRIADSSFYYLPGQENQIRERIENIAKKTGTVRQYGSPNQNVSNEIQEKREAFKQRLQEIENAEKKRDNERRENQQKKTLFSKPEQTPEPIEQEKEQQKESFIDQAMNWIKQQEYEIIKELESKKNKVELIIKANSDFGSIKFYIQIRDKKKITKMDVMSVYAKAMEKKCPGVIIIKEEIAKSAKKFLEDKKGFIKIKKI